MAMTAICDGCGKQQPAEYYNHDWHKPDAWFERTTDAGKSVMACSRECIRTADEKRGERVAILPF